MDNRPLYQKIKGMTDEEIAEANRKLARLVLLKFVVVPIGIAVAVYILDRKLNDD